MSEAIENSQTQTVIPRAVAAADPGAAAPQLAARLDADAPHGTVVLETDQTGKPTGRQFRSFRWTTKTRPSDSKQGSAQWIDMIVVGNTKEAAQKGMALLPSESPSASSSVSSRDVLAIHVDASGQRDGIFTIPYLVVPEIRKPQAAGGAPIAEKMWFNDEFTHKILNEIEETPVPEQ